MTKANLVVKEMLVDVQCKSEQWEQTSSKGNSGMAEVETLDQTSNQAQEDGR